jgi:hypothetical protein
MKTQKQRILKALKKWISAMECFQQTGSMNLTTRVSDYRKLGYIIEDKWHVSRDFKIYKLIKSPVFF